MSAADDPVPGSPAAEAVMARIKAVQAADPTGACTQVLEVMVLLSPAGVSTNLLYRAWSEGLISTRRRGLFARKPAMTDVDDVLKRMAGAFLVTFSTDGWPGAGRDRAV